MSTYSLIQVETQGSVGLIHLNRPDALNAISSKMLQEIMDALLAFDQDPDIGAIVIAGHEKVFAAGADIKEMTEVSAIEMFTSDAISTFDRIKQAKKPVIAAVNGWALGGGCELALSCDMIVAAENAVFGQPEITLGIMPGAGGTQRLARVLGKALTMEIVLNDRRLRAREALQHGLVNKVVPKEKCLEEAVILAQQIAERAPLAVKLCKEMVNNAFETSLSEGMEMERRAFYLLFASQDQKEGMRAFHEKRPPEWKGE